MPCAGALHQWVLCVAEASHSEAYESGFGAQEAYCGDSHTIAWGTTGALRIHAELAFEGTQLGRKRVARLLREMGLMGASQRKGLRASRQIQHQTAAADLINWDFTVFAPDQLWVADITGVPTWSGFLYPSVVLDAFSRRIVGWAMDTRLHTQLVLVFCP